MASILVIEDSPREVAWLAAMLPGDEVMHVPTLARAAALLQEVRFDLVVTDLRGVGGGAPLLAISDLRTALDRAGSEHVAIVLASGVDPYVMHGIAGSVRRTFALPKPYAADNVRALVARLTTTPR